MKIGLQSKLIIIFIITAVVILFLNNILLYWETRRSLENELGMTLMAISSTVASQIDAASIIIQERGDEKTRTYKNNLNKLKNIISHTGVKRIYIFDNQMRNIIDSNEYYDIGEQIFYLIFERTEIDQVFHGKTASSILFKGNDGTYYKTGYAPIFLDKEVIAVVGVEASARFLGSIEDLRRKMIYLAVISMVLAAMVGVFFAQTITRPIRQVVKYAKEIGKGNYRSTIDTSRKDEIGFLSRTMDEMKTNIIKRDSQLKLMLASVAHEIRNPLGGIELFAGLISGGTGEKSEQKQYIQKIINEVRKLKNIINNFLEYAKPASPQKKPCFVSKALEEIKPFIENELVKNNVCMRFSSLDQERETIFDPIHLKQIFTNLIKNSIQAMPDGGTILIEEKCENGEIMLTIADEGEEISDSIKEKIFDPFVTTREKGIGLGLAVVKKLIEDNNGKISLSNDRSSKVKFIITLPISD